LAGHIVLSSIVTDDVENLELVSVSAEFDKETEAIIRMVDTKNVLISNFRPLNTTNAFLKLEGIESGDLLILLTEK
jgi:hypothetical protein